MTSRAYHVGFRWEDWPELSKHAQVDSCFNEIGQWCRLSFDNYVVYTHMNEQDILHRLKKMVSLADSIYIFALDLDHVTGFAPPWFWQWMREKKAEQMQERNRELLGSEGIGSLLAKYSADSKS